MSNQNCRRTLKVVKQNYANGRQAHRSVFPTGTKVILRDKNKTVGMAHDYSQGHKWVHDVCLMAQVCGLPVIKTNP